ncbi:cellulase family glycosylhydrolase, partial [Streptomyces albogriseolus]
MPITHRAATPVDAHGRLQVCGTQLCDQYGVPVQLRGMSTHGTQWYARCLTDASLDALAHDWRADVLRVSTYVQEGGYETDPAHFTALADRLIRQASDRGLYVIVDWHMLTPGDPMANLDGTGAGDGSGDRTSGVRAGHGVRRDPPQSR